MATRTDTAFLETYRRRTREVVEGVDLEPISAAVDVVFEGWRRRALVVLAGNGGSAATASHFANDLAKATRCVGRLPMRAVSITDNASLMTALANDDGYETIFASQMETLFRPGDVFIALSASGESENILHAAKRAVEVGGYVISLVGFSGGTLPEISDVTIHVPTDSGEYGPVEDAHLVLTHMITGCLLERIRAAPVTALAGNGSATETASRD